MLKFILNGDISLYIFLLNKWWPTTKKRLLSELFFYNRRSIMSLKNNRYVTTIIVWMLAFKLLIWRRHHYRWGDANFDLCSVLMAIGQWRYFSVQHLLWHGSVTTCPYGFGLSQLGFKRPSFPLRGERLNPLRHSRGTIWNYILTILILLQ